MTEIPRIAVESAEEFHQQYANKNKPVIITNFQDGWADKEKFTRAGLSERVRWGYHRMHDLSKIFEMSDLYVLILFM
jgi:hypothetical protein